MWPNIDGFIMQKQNTLQTSNDRSSVTVSSQDEGIVSVDVFNFGDFQQSNITF